MELLAEQLFTKDDIFIKFIERCENISSGEPYMVLECRKNFVIKWKEFGLDIELLEDNAILKITIESLDSLLYNLQTKEEFLCVDCYYASSLLSICQVLYNNPEIKQCLFLQYLIGEINQRTNLLEYNQDSLDSFSKFIGYSECILPDTLYSLELVPILNEHLYHDISEQRIHDNEDQEELDKTNQNLTKLEIKGADFRSEWILKSEPEHDTFIVFTAQSHDIIYADHGLEVIYSGDRPDGKLNSLLKGSLSSFIKYRYISAQQQLDKYLPESIETKFVYFDILLHHRNLLPSYTKISEAINYDIRDEFIEKFEDENMENGILVPMKESNKLCVPFII